MNSTSTFTGAQIVEWGSLCVYAWKRGEEFLYVGVSTRGLARPLYHETVNVKEPVLPSDSFEVWFFPEGTDWLTAQAFENSLIAQHDPKYNIAYNPRRCPAKPKPDRRTAHRVAL